MTLDRRPLSSPVAREPRYPYAGRVRLMVPFEPWRLLISLRGADLSTTGVSALLPQQAAGAADAEALLVEGDPYDLQLDHDAEHLPAPVIRARLARRARTSLGWQLAFAFEAPDVGLLGLVHELGSRS